MSRNDRTKTAPDPAPDVERLLARERHSSIPEPRQDLVSRTIRRIQNWVVVGDLLRFATFENQWKALARRHEKAEKSRDRKSS